MEKYIHLFNTQAELKDAYLWTVYNSGAPFLSYTEETSKVNYNKKVADTNGVDYVDLGLPNGTLWATKNIGSTTPYEVGGSYCWGAITETGYCPYKKNDRDVIKINDDVANVILGGDWHIPRPSQLQELLNGTVQQFTLVNNKNVVVLTSKTNGNTLILPTGISGGEDEVIGYWGNMVVSHYDGDEMILSISIDIDCDYGNSIYTDNDYQGNNRNFVRGVIG